MANFDMAEMALKSVCPNNFMKYDDIIRYLTGLGDDLHSRFHTAVHRKENIHVA